MSTKIYVGNLAFSTDSAALRSLFAPLGEVTTAEVVQDRDTGRSRGFGFVEMASAEEAQKAIAATDGKTIDGRRLTVNLARSRTS
jgi:RNA recognition motif-containing protein